MVSLFVQKRGRETTWSTVAEKRGTSDVVASGRSKLYTILTDFKNATLTPLDIFQKTAVISM